MLNGHFPFENEPLPYAYEALEPYIDAQTMRLHHDKHLQSYVDNLNLALKRFPDLQSAGLKSLVCAFSHPCGRAATAVSRNAGGVFNHRFYFEGMSPDGGEACGSLKIELVKKFGSIEQFLEKFIDCAAGVFGSGYLWLVSDKCCGLRLISTANQETPFGCGFFPILCVDIWEHAYYLKYQNRRREYLEGWVNLINWERAEQQYLRRIVCKRV